MGYILDQDRGWVPLQLETKVLRQKTLYLLYRLPNGSITNCMAAGKENLKVQPT